MRVLNCARIGFFSVLLILGLSACGKGRGVKPVTAQGTWIQRDEVEELRATGKIESLCADLKGDPDSKIRNVRLIDSVGAAYIYDPQVGPVEQLKLGVISLSGTLEPTPFFKQQIGDASVRVSVKGDVMTFLFTDPKGDTGIEYMRSSDREVRRYYAAQEQCRN